MTELEDVHSSGLETRLSNFLLLRASADGHVRMTQQEIASHLGTTREVAGEGPRAPRSCGDGFRPAGAASSSPIR